MRGDVRFSGAVGRAVAITGLLALLVAACSTGEETNDATITVAAGSDNTLIADVSIATGAATDLLLDVTSEQTKPRTIVSPFDAGDHQLSVVGLRADTTYTFQARRSDDGTPIGDPIEHTTGALPAGAPSVEIIDAIEGDESAADGITFFGLVETGRNGGGNTTDGPAFWGIDGDGEIVWYLNPTNPASGNPVIRGIGDGELLVTLADSLDRVTLAGGTIDSFDLSGVRGWHHDVVTMPDGGVLLLGRETQDVDGQELRGDTVIRLDATGNTVFEWSSFDHLDTSRFPGELSRSEARSGGTDWTHANAVFFDEPRNQILISLRNQNWIVAIDADSGEVVWVAGDDNDVSPDFDADFLELASGQWTSGQHAAFRTPEGDLVVYDNRNETGGPDDNSRGVIYHIDDAAGTATQVTEVIAPKFTESFGDIDLLPGGNLLITAGGPGSDNSAYLIEADADGDTIWTAAVDGRIYRSERVSWASIDSAAAGALMAGFAVAVDDTPDRTPDEAAAADRGNADRNGNAANNRQPAIAPPSAEDLVDPVDLTGVTLTSTAGVCTDHVGQFTSTANDASNGNVLNGALIVTTDGQFCTLESNAIPNHDVSVNTNFANETGEVANRYVIPVQPELTADPTDLGPNTHAIMLNGVVWEAFPAACFNQGDGQLGSEAIGCGPDLVDHPWRYNVGSELNVFRLDDYSAHSQGDGLYHYHGTPQALYTMECAGIEDSPVIGFARDGFPIFGPCFTDADGTVRAAQSSFQLKTGVREDVEDYLTPYRVGGVASDEYNGQFINDFEFVDGSGDLDRCNGMEVDDQYGYYITGEFPYVLSCFSGTPSDDFGRLN